jgi:DnaJ-class molecular chaperone
VTTEYDFRGECKDCRGQGGWVCPHTRNVTICSECKGDGKVMDIPSVELEFALGREKERGMENV